MPRVGYQACPVGYLACPVGMAWLGTAQLGSAWLGLARLGSARCDTVKRKPFWAWLSMARPVLGLPGLAQSSLAWASHGPARFGLVPSGPARLGSAQHSVARLVLAGSG
jgi:hypothetical protein